MENPSFRISGIHTVIGLTWHFQNKNQKACRLSELDPSKQSTSSKSKMQTAHQWPTVLDVVINSLRLQHISKYEYTINYLTPSSIRFTRFFLRGATAPSGPRFIVKPTRLHWEPPHSAGPPLDKRSARRRDLYISTHNTHKWQTSMPQTGFEPTTQASERPQDHVLDRTATEKGQNLSEYHIKISYENSVCIVQEIRLQNPPVRFEAIDTVNLLVTDFFFPNFSTPCI